MVARARNPERCRVWEGHFQHPLPAIPVPLAKGDADLGLTLKPLVETIYRRFRYEQSIDCTVKLAPPLSTAEAAWFRRQLQTRRRS